MGAGFAGTKTLPPKVGICERRPRVKNFGGLYPEAGTSGPLKRCCVFVGTGTPTLAVAAAIRSFRAVAREKIADWRSAVVAMRATLSMWEGMVERSAKLSGKGKGKVEFKGGIKEALQ